jgi:hypothetical protein
MDQKSKTEKNIREEDEEEASITTFEDLQVAKATPSTELRKKKTRKTAQAKEKKAQSAIRQFEEAYQPDCTSLSRELVPQFQPDNSQPLESNFSQARPSQTQTHPVSILKQTKFMDSKLRSMEEIGAQTHSVKYSNETLHERRKSNTARTLVQKKMNGAL